jgi:hypothetical protein
MSLSEDDMEVEMDGKDPYSDHEHINLGFTANPDNNQEIELSLDPLDDELDGGQVAELVHYDRSLNVDKLGLEIGIGYNVAPEQFAAQSAQFKTTEEFDNDAGKLAIYEEPGIIDSISLKAGDAATALQAEKHIDYLQRYDQGIFVDGTDDLSFFLEVEPEGNTDAFADGQLQFVYKIHEVAQGVPQFANPARLMR